MENNKNTKYNKSVKKNKDFNPFPQDTDNINEKLTELGSNIDEQSIHKKKNNSSSLMDNPANDKNIENLCKYFEESFKQDELIDEDTESKNFLLSFRKSKNNSITNQEVDLISDLTKENDENQYLKPKEWKYINKVNFEEIDNKFMEVKNKFNKEEVKEIYNDLKIKTIDSLYKSKQEKEPKNIINKLENLDNMIENYLFVSSSPNKRVIDYEREELEKYIYKYRYIFRDNNNFYRCTIFAFLENIILTNNFMCLKELLIEIDDKISLKNETINNNDYLKNEVELNININLIKMLLYILIKYMCKNINKSYETLIKIYLLYEEFDYGMIFIIRFLLHEYINENKYKIFSKDNKVDIIELLPQKYTSMYITNEKKFELFYLNELFKMKSYDNKLVFYMIPFFFDINLKVISYYHGAENPIYTKFYRNEKDKYTLELISYKGNLDICYNKKYYEFHSKYLNIFEENNEKILFIKKSSNSSNKSNKSNEKNNVNNKEIIYNNNNKINIIIENNLKKDNNEDNENNLNIEELKNKNILICSNCSKEYKGKENKLKLCPECLDEEFRNDILKLYGLYLQYVDHNYKKYGFQIDKYFGSIIHTIKINEITIYDAMADTGYLVYEILNNVKINICLICRNDTTKNYYYQLPCECRLCSKKCFKKYIEIMIYQDFEKIEKNNFKRMIFVFDNCICGKKYYYADLLVLYNYFKNKNKLKICEMIIKIVKNRWKWRCIKCDKHFDPFCMNYRLSLFDAAINKDFYDKELKHLICSECYDSIYISQIKHVKCIFCKSEHYIVDSKRLTYENKSGDLCFII